MRSVKRIILGCLFLFFGMKVVLAQTKPPFWEDIQVIKQYDRIYHPPQSPILFTGSSSIRLWDNLSQMFSSYNVMNRGIGGAVNSDIDRYVEDIMVPYKPRQIVLYIGENDIVSAPNGDSIFVGFQKLYRHIRSYFPDVPIAYISIKPSPSREKFLPLAVRANNLTHAFLKTEPNTVFIDVYSPMLDKNGHTRPELFKEDMLHMKQEGYLIWYEKIKPFLLKK